MALNRTQLIDDQLTDKKIVFDTNCYIYFFEGIDPYKSVLKPLFKLIEQGKIELVASVVNYLELLSCTKLTQKQKDLYQLFFSPELNYVKLAPVDLMIAQKAAELRRTHGFKTPDAILLATALQHQVDYFVSNDFQLDKPLQLDSDAQQLRIINLKP
jgi:predicted nucleic acid-binding protein